MPFCIESEQKEPAEVDTLPSQLQSPPNLSALALIHCIFHAKLNVDHVCKLFMETNPRRMTGAGLSFSEMYCLVDFSMK